MTTLTQSQLADQEWDVVTAQLQQIKQDLSEAEQARDEAQVAFLGELVLLLHEKRLLIVKEDLAYLRAQEAVNAFAYLQEDSVYRYQNTRHRGWL
ncbi:hypothetical protein ABBQ38_013078 [Trebouxia sp. C0009 RCD-2024]